MFVFFHLCILYTCLSPLYGHRHNLCVPFLCQVQTYDLVSLTVYIHDCPPIELMNFVSCKLLNLFVLIKWGKNLLLGQFSSNLKDFFFTVVKNMFLYVYILVQFMILNLKLINLALGHFDPPVYIEWSLHAV